MKRTKLAGLVLVAGVIFTRTVSLLAQGTPIQGTAAMSLSANPASPSVGTSVSISVVADLSSVTGNSPAGSRTPAVLGGYQIGIAFDKTRLQFDSVAGGSSTGYTTAPTVTNPNVANASGALTIVASQTSATGPTGVVSVAVLSFTAIGSGTAALTVNPSLVSAFQPGPPAVGPASIPGSGGATNLIILGPGGTPTPSPTPPPNPTPTPTVTLPPPPGGTPTPTPPSGAPTPTPANPNPSAPRARAVVVPIASHVIGSGGLVFVTDLAIQNPGSAFAVGSLSFTPVGGTTATVPIVVAPYETRSLPDVVGIQFGIFDGVGSLRLDSALPLRMTSRNYQRSFNGSFGQAVAGFTRAETVVSARSLTGLARTDSYRTNLGAVNDSGSLESFRITLWSNDGSSFGSTPVFDLGPGAQMQWSLSTLFPNAVGTGLTAQFEGVSGAAAPFGYASVADNLSGDPTYYASREPAAVLSLPISARVTGSNGKKFLSEISMANVTDVPITVTVRFLEHDRDNTGAGRVASVPIAARQTRHTDDALRELFAVDETFGALEFGSSVAGSLLVSERIYTDSSTTAGTVGQQIDPVDGGALLTYGSLLGIQQNVEFRSNLGFFNPQDTPAEVTLTLRRDSGSSVGKVSLTVPPRSYLQRNVTVLFPNVGFSSSLSWSVAMESSVEIFACSVMVDNISEDSTYLPAFK